MTLAERLWGLRPHAYRVLDRRGLRPVLSRAATWAARRESGDDVEILFRDGVWMYRLGQNYLAGPPEFRFAHGADLRTTWETLIRNAADSWFAPYQPKAGGVIVDIGAGSGTNLPLFHDAVGATGRVVAVEANPNTFRRLRAMVRCNGYRNVVICNAALMDAPGPVYVEDRPVETYTRASVSRRRRTGDLAVPVEGITLDELGNRFDIDEIELLKVNIEGAEGIAVQGMAEMIGRTRAVVVACHDFDGTPTRETVSRFLAEHGFEVWSRDVRRQALSDR